MVDLIIWLIVGAAAGWIAGIVVKGAGFGPLGNIIVGILGSIVAGFIFGETGGLSPSSQHHVRFQRPPFPDRRN